jgi:hypothetical protein
MGQRRTLHENIFGGFCQIKISGERWCVELFFVLSTHFSPGCVIAVGGRRRKRGPMITPVGNWTTGGGGCCCNRVNLFGLCCSPPSVLSASIVVLCAHDRGRTWRRQQQEHTQIKPFNYYYSFVCVFCCVCSCGGSLTRRKNNKPDRNVSELLVERSVALAQPPVRPSELTNEWIKEVER